MRHGDKVAAVAAACTWMAASSYAQNRGVHPLGMTAINSGLMPESTFTYSNQFLLYTRDEAKDNGGNTPPVTGNHAVILDMNTIAWVMPERKILAAQYAVSATLPYAKNDLTSDLQGQLSGGNGFGDSYYLPVILGWRWTRAAVRAMYGFLAPTGRFHAGANDNVGAGYWTHLSSGQTFYLTPDKRVALSTFELYEFHTEQEGTGIHPGETFNLDYSFLYSMARTRSFQLQGRIAGYEQRQTTARTGPDISAAQSEDRYAINALGFAVLTILPKRASVGLKYFEEFANRSTFQGYSLQVIASIGF